MAGVAPAAETDVDAAREATPAPEAAEPVGPAPAAEVTEKSPWDDPRLPWTGKPGQADIACWAAARRFWATSLAILLPFRAALVGTHPVLGELLNGSTESVIAAAAFARTGHGSLVVAILAAFPGIMKFDLVWWWAGSLWGEKLILLISGRRSHGPRYMPRVHKWGRRFTGPAVIVSPFLPIPTRSSTRSPLGRDAPCHVHRAGLHRHGAVGGLPSALAGARHHAVVVAQTISKYSLWFSLGIVVIVVVGQFRPAAARARCHREPARNSWMHVTDERASGLAVACAFRAVCVMRESPGSRVKLLGVAMSLNQAVDLPTRKRVVPARHQPLDVSARATRVPGRPRVVRMPADWWESPSVIGCPLTRGPQSARNARRLTRSRCATGAWDHSPRTLRPSSGSSWPTPSPMLPCSPTRAAGLGRITLAFACSAARAR